MGLITVKKHYRKTKNKVSVVRKHKRKKRGGYLKDSDTYVTKDGKETKRGLWANVYLKKKKHKRGDAPYLKYAKARAKSLGLIAEKAENPDKKIDLFENDKGKKGKKVSSIGAKGYGDYPTYLAKERKGLVKEGTAAKKRKGYKKRHTCRNEKGTDCYYADKVLW